LHAPIVDALHVRMQIGRSRKKLSALIAQVYNRLLASRARTPELKR
jgi:hypothetical protein